MLHFDSLARMRLVILGSGTSVPHAQRTSSAYWLETSGGFLLLDLGPDAAHRMAEERLDWANLDAIWISHFHLDHLGGLAPFLFGTKWAPQTQQRTKPLKVFGPAGIKTLLQAFDQANNYRLLHQPYAIEVIEIEPSSGFEILPGLDALTFATPHTRESLAIRLTDSDGTSFVYTSDTGPSEELAAFAKDVDLLLMECSFRRHKPIQNHLEFEEAMAIARQANARKVVLTHLYPEWDGINLAAEAKTLWSGDTIAAADGLVLEING
jgi:ribonuclease BN (tRNA processing enzyme)